MREEQLKIAVIHHTHWDREWYQSFDAMQIRLRDAIRMIVEMIEHGEIGCFYLDGQTCVLDDYREIVTEEEFEKLEDFIRRGKIQVGPWYVLADEFLCPPEACIKNLEIGRKMAGRYGSFCDIGYLPDTFGHIGSMPQILQGFGIPCAVIWRGADPQHCEVWWKGNDGSRVAALVLSTRDGYYQTFMKQKNSGDLLDRYLDFHSGEKQWQCPVVMDGADHTVCNPDVMDHMRAYGEKKSLEFVEILPDQLCRDLLKSDLRETIEGELRDSSKIFVLSGTWSTRMYLKVQNQRCTDALVHRAEFLNAWENGASRSEALLEKLWKRLLVNQAHDSICGCSIDTVHRDMEHRFGRILESVEQYEHTVLNRMYPYEYRDGAVSNRWLHLIHNTPYKERRLVTADILLRRTEDQGDISIYDGDQQVEIQVIKREEKEEFFHETASEPWYEDMVHYQIAFLMDFCGMEHRCLRIEPCLPWEHRESCQADSISNEYYECWVSGDGITVRQKQTGITYPCQHLWVSCLDAGDSYNCSPPEHQQTTACQLVSAACRKDGSRQVMDSEWLLEVPAGLNQERTGASQEKAQISIKTRFQLIPGNPMILVHSQVQNEARDQKLKVEFHLPRMESHASDTAFDLVRRTVRNGQEGTVGNGHERVAENQEELEIVQDPTNSQIYAGDLQIVHIGMQEYQVEQRGEESVCSLTALRCTGDLSRRDLRTRGGGAGPGFETPDAQCIGTWEFTYGLLYGRELFSAAHAVMLKTEPLMKQSCVSAPEERKLMIEGNVLYSSLVYSGGSWILRVVNQSDEDEEWTLKLARPHRVWMTDLKGENLEWIGDGQQFPMTAGGKKIVTIRMERR